MLSKNPFTIQFIFLQVINYFKFISSVKANETNSKNSLTLDEENALILSSLVSHVIILNCKNKLFLPDLNEDAYVTVASFDSRLNKIDLLEEKLSGSILEVRTCYKADDIKNAKTLQKDYIQDFVFIFDPASQNSNDFEVCIWKNAYNKILANIHNNPNHLKTEILLNLSNGKSILLLQIRVSPVGNMHIFFPQEDLSKTTINKLLAKTSYSYPEIHKGIFMYIIELLKREINKNNLKIAKMGDTLNLHFDESPTLFLYYTTNTPSLQFFEKFTITLKPFDEQSSQKQIFQNFGFKPSVLIEFSKTNISSSNYINLQITEYKYNVKLDRYFINNEKGYISYKKIEFDKTAITTQQESAVLNTSIRTPKILVIEMYFDKKSLPYGPDAYEALENSLYEVIISPHEKENESIIIDTKSFKIKNNANIFSISLNNIMLFINKNPSIKLTLVNGSGVFKVIVKSKTKNIIESIVCLDNSRMVIISSNRLIEHLRELGFENYDMKISSKNSLPDGDLSLTNLNRKMDSGSYQQVATSSMNKTSTPRANLPLDRSSEKTKTRNPKEDHASSLKKSHKINTGGSQRPDNTNPATKVTKTTTSEDLTKSISKPKSEDTPSSLKKSHKINTGGSQRPDNTNPATKVTKTTTPEDLTKITSKPKSEGTPSDSKNTPENEEEKTGNKSIIIIYVILGVVVVIGLIAYIYFF